MANIEIYDRFDPTDGHHYLDAHVAGKNFFSELSSEEGNQIIENWIEVLGVNPDAFSRENGLGTLWNYRDGKASFRPTDFATYAAVTRTHAGKSLSQIAYGSMRVGAVGGVVELEDGSVFVHKRSKNATHVPNAWDMSVAGLVPVSNWNELDFKAALLDKLEGELGIARDEIESIRTIGFHGARDPDFSAMFDYKVRTRLNASQIEDRARGNKGFEDYKIVPRGDLPGHIVDTYKGTSLEGVCLDGCGALLMNLDEIPFLETLGELRSSGREIEFGSVENGRFVSHSEKQ